MNDYFSDETYSHWDKSGQKLDTATYENCEFHHCNFIEANISYSVFIDCIFSNCNFSLAKLHSTALRTVTFKDCKLVGVIFDHCNSLGFDARFDACILQQSTFVKLNLKKFVFRHCDMQSVDFSECDLSAALFDTCNLLAATFDQTNLEKADLSTSYNIELNPNNNKLRKAKFSRQSLEGLVRAHDLIIVD